MQRVQRTVLGGFAIAMVVLAAVWASSLALTQKLIDDSRQDDHTREVLGALDDLYAAVLEAQSVARGHVLVADSNRLGAFVEAQTRITQHVTDLRMLTADNPRQQERITRLEPILKQRLDQLNEALDDWTRNQQDAARQLLAGNDGRAVMGRFEEVLGSMYGEEQSLLKQRLATQAASANHTMMVTGLGSLLALLAVALAFVRIRRQIHERAQADEALSHAQQAADAANRSKSAFLANMSHEIRTPVAAIIGFGDLLLDAQLSASERLDSINTIRRNSQHLLTVINDILDLSKVEAGQMVVEAVPCSPCQIISDVASMMRVRATEKRLEFEVRIAGLIPETIHSDPIRLRQILINLLSNAIKFTQVGWVRLAVRLATPPEAAKPRLRFEVADTGVGLTPDQVAHIFQPFVQGDSSTTRRFGGTGLGLSISQRLAHMLGGEITVDSTPGRGCTFATEVETGPLAGVRLISRCTESYLDAEPAEPSAGEEVVAGSRGTVLVAEDGVDNRNLLAYSLRKAGYHVDFAEDGRVAVQKAHDAARRGTPYDVILMDMQMPELDGYGAAAKLRSMNYAGTIIALTANAMKEDRDKCLSAGCNDYLSKPVDRRVLLQTVRRYATVSAAGVPPVARAEAAEIARLRADYIAGLPGQVAHLAQALERQDRAAVQDLVHQMRGTAGMFGLDWVTYAAMPIDEHLRAGRDLSAVAARIHELIDRLRRAEGYQRDRETTSTS